MVGSQTIKTDIIQQRDERIYGWKEPKMETNGISKMQWIKLDIQYSTCEITSAQLDQCKFARDQLLTAYQQSRKKWNRRTAKHAHKTQLD